MDDEKNVSTESIVLCLLEKLLREGEWQPTSAGKENNGAVIVYSHSEGAIAHVLEPGPLREIVHSCLSFDQRETSCKRLEQVLQWTRSRQSIIPFVFYRCDSKEGLIGSWDYGERAWN